MRKSKLSQNLNQKIINKKPNSNPLLNQKLIDEAAKHNLSQVKELIQKGADPNYVRYTNSNDWYTGNTHSALYTAVHSNFTDQKNYLDVIQFLLESGANPNFKAVRGNWNHSTLIPLFSRVSQILKRFKSQKQKIRFIEMFVKFGGDINQIEHHERQKHFRGYRIRKCFLFQLMNESGIIEKFYQLAERENKINLNQLRNAAYNQDYKMFMKETNRKMQENQQPNQQQQPNQEQQEGKQKFPETQLIKAIINLGGDANSFRSQQRFQISNQDYSQQIDQQLIKYYRFQQNLYETVLHRCISNNLEQLIKFLIEKGADVHKTCKYTISKALYPNQWPDILIDYKNKKNQQNLKQSQKQRANYLQQLKKAQSQQQKQQVQQMLKDVEFRIFRAKRFSIQNQLPVLVYENKQVTCLQLAQLFNVDEKIKQFLKQKMNK